MRYLVTILGTAALLMVSAATLNWAIDPAGVFRKTSFGQRYAKALMASEYGLVSPKSVDEREFKVELAKHSVQYDCVVIGSSHVMQVGSARKHRSFPGCRSILNLGVSGAAIEDHVVLTWLTLSEGKPRMLILGIDPWTFAFGKDARWKVRYTEQYYLARNEIEGTKLANSRSSDHWSSLITGQYTARSLDQLLRGSITPTIDAVQRVDEDVGDKLPIVLPDGSLVYSAEYIANAKKSSIPVGGYTYATDGMVNDLRAINLYRKLILWVRLNGVKPVLLMTPYHQNVWMLEASPNVKAMEPTEKIVREIGSELDVPVIGSYKPDIVGCLPSEFYDFMHPMASCVARFAGWVEP